MPPTGKQERERNAAQNLNFPDFSRCLSAVAKRGWFGGKALPHVGVFIVTCAVSEPQISRGVNRGTQISSGLWCSTVLDRHSLGLLPSGMSAVVLPNPQGNSKEGKGQLEKKKSNNPTAKPVSPGNWKYLPAEFFPHLQGPCLDFIKKHFPLSGAGADMSRGFVTPDSFLLSCLGFSCRILFFLPSLLFGEEALGDGCGIFGGKVYSRGKVETIRTPGAH